MALSWGQDPTPFLGFLNRDTAHCNFKEMRGLYKTGSTPWKSFLQRAPSTELLHTYRAVGLHACPQPQGTLECSSVLGPCCCPCTLPCPGRVPNAAAGELGCAFTELPQCCQLAKQQGLKGNFLKLKSHHFLQCHLSYNYQARNF